MIECGLGWRPELEAQHAEALAGMMRPMCASLGRLTHQEIDPRSAIPCNDQGQRKSCEGNSRAKCGEYCNWIETGRWVKLSARFSYLTSRIIDGTNDQPDAGASISGGVLASRQYGECTEEILPYWSDQERFDSLIPQPATAMGQGHKLRSSTPISGTDAAIVFLDAGLGAITFGIYWTQGLAQFRGEFLDSSQAGGQFVGGHALALLGFVTRGQEQWPIMYNSHSSAWGDRGTAVVDPRLWDRWLQQSPFGAIGVSDLPDFGGGPREFKDWSGILT